MDYLTSEQVNLLRTAIKSIKISGNLIKYKNRDLAIKFKFPNCLSNKKIVKTIIDIYNTHTTHNNKYLDINKLIIDDTNFTIDYNEMVLNYKVTNNSIDIYENSYEHIRIFVLENQEFSKKMVDFQKILETTTKTKWSSFSHENRIHYSTHDKYHIYKKIVLDITCNSILEYGIEYVYLNDEIVNIDKLDNILEILDNIANKFKDSIVKAGSSYAGTSGKFIGFNKTVEDFNKSLEEHDQVFKVVNINCFCMTLCSPDIARSSEGFCVSTKDYNLKEGEFKWHCERFDNIEAFLDYIRVTHPKLLRKSS